MEIERKFLVGQGIEHMKLDEYESFDIEQCYISTIGNEVRIRKIDDQYRNCECFLTIKSNGGMSREEVEMQIPWYIYDDLIKMHVGDIIKKKRFKIPLETNNVAELDIYEGDLIRLKTVEVEFETIEGANTFNIPIWFSQEVTLDKRYKNKNLALNRGEI